MRRKSRRRRSSSLAALRITGFACVLALSGFAAGCSPAPYSAVVDRFAEATARAEESLRILNTDITQDFDSLLKERMQAQAGVALVEGDDECTTDSPRCRLVISSADPLINEQFYPPEPHLGDLVAVMHRVNEYAGNLSALMKDDSAADAKESIAATFESIQGLATTVAKASNGRASAIPEFGAPVGSAVNWLAGQYANRVKLSGLRSATDAADSDIQRAAGLAAEVSARALQAQATHFSDNLTEKLAALDGGITENGLTAAASAAAAYDALLRSQPKVVFENLADAHSALTQSLHSDDVPLAEAIAQMEEFADSAEELATVVEQLRSIETE